MKYFLLTFVSLFFLTSCMKNQEEETLYGGIGTAHKLEDSRFYFKFDNGATFMPVGVNFNNNVLDDSTRVILTFVLEDENVGGYTYTGRLEYLDTLLTKKALVYDEELPDTLGRNKAIISDGYIFHKYLNLEFGVVGANSRHEINLVMTEQDQSEDSEFVKAAFMDKITGNAVGYGYGIVCFDISEIQKRYPGKKGIIVKATDYNYNSEHEYKYEFPKNQDADEKMDKKSFSHKRLDIR